MTAQTITAAAAPRFEAFTFDDPTPVLESRGVFDYLECWQNGRWYEPPVSLEGLSKTKRANVYLQSGLLFKRNALVNTYVPHRLLPRQQFAQLATDFVTFGMAYLVMKIITSHKQVIVFGKLHYRILSASTDYERDNLTSCEK